MLNCRWNRRTREGTVSACEPTGGAIIGKVMDAVTEVESAPLFWYDEVFYNSRQYCPDPYGEPPGQIFLCDYWFWLRRWDEEALEWKDAEVVLRVEDYIGAVVRDIDQDGCNEVVVRTRWPEKPYKIYDWENSGTRDGEITVTWLEALSPEQIEGMMVPEERQGELEACLGIGLP